jgi:hypothetical protein
MARLAGTPVYDAAETPWPNGRRHASVIGRDHRRARLPSAAIAG